MRILICCVIVLALVLVTGCAKQETKPAPDAASAPEAPADPQPIASEDFESGEADGAVHEGEDDTEDDAEETDAH